MDLESACEINNLEVIKKLCITHDDINWAFQLSCLYGHIDSAKLLHNLGANVHHSRGKSFKLACQNRNYDIAQWIYDIDHTILCDTFWMHGYEHYNDFVMACIVNNIDKAKLLYNPINFKKMIKYILNVVCTLGHLDIVKWLHTLIESDPHINNSALKEACEQNHFEIVKWLLTLDIDIDIDDDYLFRYSCRYGYMEIAKMLFNAGANIRANNDESFRTACKLIIKDRNSEFDENASEIIKWLYSLDMMILIDSMEYLKDDFNNILDILDLDENTTNQMKCINDNKQLPQSEITDDIVFETLFKYNKIEELTRLDLPYVTYDVVDGKICNGKINRRQLKSARKL